MYQAIIVVHVLLGLGVVGLVLLQHGKGADAGAAFGSASSGSVFGAQGASSFLSRSTAILATLFFSTSLGLAVMSGNLGSEVDLMDAQDVEEVFADVPLVNGTESLNLDTLPVLSDDVPAAIEQGITDTLDTITQKTKSAVEVAGEKASTAIEEMK